MAEVNDDPNVPTRENVGSKQHGIDRFVSEFTSQLIHAKHQITKDIHFMQRAFHLIQYSRDHPMKSEHFTSERAYQQAWIRRIADIRYAKTVIEKHFETFLRSTIAIHESALSEQCPDTIKFEIEIYLDTLTPIIYRIQDDLEEAEYEIEVFRALEPTFVELVHDASGRFVPRTVAINESFPASNEVIEALILKLHHLHPVNCYEHSLSGTDQNQETELSQVFNPMLESSLEEKSLMTRFVPNAVHFRFIYPIFRSESFYRRRISGGGNQPTIGKRRLKRRKSHFDHGRDKRSSSRDQKSGGRSGKKNGTSEGSKEEKFPSKTKQSQDFKKRSCFCDIARGYA